MIYDKCSFLRVNEIIWQWMFSIPTISSISPHSTTSPFPTLVIWLQQTLISSSGEDLFPLLLFAHRSSIEEVFEQFHHFSEHALLGVASDPTQRWVKLLNDLKCYVHWPLKKLEGKLWLAPPTQYLPQSETLVVFIISTARFFDSFPY